MEPEDNKPNDELQEKKQDEKDISGINRLLQEGAKNTKNKFSMLFRKFLTAVVVPILIKLAPLLIIIMTLSIVVTWWNDEHGKANASNQAVSKVLESTEQTDIALSDEGNGYYFKISQDSLDKYIEELNKAYSQGYYSAEVDDNEIIPEEELNEIEERFNSSDIEEWFGTDDRELCKAYFMKMLRAHIASTYPRLGSYGTPENPAAKTDIKGNPIDNNGDYVAQGVVKIKRTPINEDGTKGQVKELDYLPYEEFSERISNNDSSVLNYFSFNSSKGVIYYPTYTYKKETVTIGSGTPTVTESTELHENSVSYSSLLSMCNMSYNYLFTLLQVSQNPEWVMAVIDLLLDESEVVLMIQDQLSVVDYTEVSDNAVKTVTEYYEYVKSEEDESDEGEEETGSWEPTDPIQTTTYEFSKSSLAETITTSTHTNTAVAFIEKAKTWCIDFEQEVGEEPNKIETQGTEEVYSYTTEDLATYSYTISSDFESGFPDPEEQTECTKQQISFSDDKLQYSTKTDTKNYTWTPFTKTEKTINESRFLGTLKNDRGIYYPGAEYKEDGIEVKYPEPGQTRTTIVAANSISDGTGQDIDWLLSLLSMHEDTQIHEQLMMYYWNKYMGVDIYDSEINSLLNLFNISTLSTISGSALENYIKAWENDALWRYETGLSTTFPSGYLSEDGQNYIVYEDGSNGHNNISYGIATFISSSSATETNPTYGTGYYNWKEEFAKYGVDITTLKTGDLVPVDIVESVFSEILGGFEERVGSYLSTHGLILEQTQKDALVAVCYQYESIYGFEEAYNASIDREGNIDPQAIKDNFILTAREDKVKPFDDTSSNETIRKHANWYLFTEGIYTDRSGNVIHAFGGTILECAKQIHDYMSDSTHTYYYCLNGNEKSKQEHRDAGLPNCGLNSSFEASQVPGNDGYRLTCCATYVSWVLESAGYLQTHTDSSNQLLAYLSNSGWQEVKYYDQLAPGDIVFMDTDGANNGVITHVQIYVGNGTWYNAGNNNSIHKVEPYSSNVSGEFVTALRAPN